MVAGLVGLGVAGVGGWSMYYLETQEHETNTAQLAGEVRNHQRHIDSLQAQTAELETRVEEIVPGAEGLSKEEQANLLRERETLLERLALAETEQTRLIKEREVLSKNLDLIKNEHGQLSAELDSMQAAREQLRSELGDAQTALDRITAELGEKIQAREQALSESTNRVDSINAQLSEASGKIGSLEFEVHTLGRERSEIQVRFAELRKKLESDLETRNVEIEQLKGNLTIIRLASDILFDPGSAELKDVGRDALALIAEVLNEFPDRQISLEGHTDSVPISARLQDVYPTNWELSTARAARAVRYLQLRGITPQRIRVVGYGQYRPVVDNDDPALRARNRRLEIMLLPLSQEIREHDVSSD